MTWRDNPAIVWQDDDEDRIELVGGFLAAVETDRMGYESGIDVAAPVSVEERVEATERWLAALGLTADNIRELPRPIGVGDIVMTGRGGMWFLVVHVDNGWAMLRPLLEPDQRLGAPLLEVLENLIPIEPDDSDSAEADLAEPEWVITRDPAVLAAAIDAGRTAQFKSIDDEWWVDSEATAADFRRLRSDSLVVDYRYEGPVIEAQVDRCTPDNRTCEHDEPWCAEELSGFLRSGSEANWWCSRPPGHDGPHIPCSAAGDVYGVDVHHNFHLRPEDR